MTLSMYQNRGGNHGLKIGFGPCHTGDVERLLVSTLSFGSKMVRFQVLPSIPHLKEYLRLPKTKGNDASDMATRGTNSQKGENVHSLV